MSKHSRRGKRTLLTRRAFDGVGMFRTTMKGCIAVFVEHHPRSQQPPPPKRMTTGPRIWMMCVRPVLKLNVLLDSWRAFALPCAPIRVHEEDTCLSGGQQRVHAVRPLRKKVHKGDNQWGPTTTTKNIGLEAISFSSHAGSGG
ncbi:magnesium and cobalt transport protein [Anopheles sinensis]|uniref:Magnesium and cobalt transport protein n=1 Tax=Anopheles sinensis TaxID=74873 RepID=A0A084VG30_ANOSI|nr:magnesium and cobalt transport protein [Anopheles sinensis]